MSLPCLIRDLACNVALEWRGLGGSCLEIWTCRILDESTLDDRHALHLWCVVASVRRVALPAVQLHPLFVVVGIAAVVRGARFEGDSHAVRVVLGLLQLGKIAPQLLLALFDSSGELLREVAEHQPPNDGEEEDARAAEVAALLAGGTILADNLTLSQAILEQAVEEAVP
eukprot:scaffold3504_cov240-Pinguiococcus_pyrenoidosus.AAC.59